MISISQDGKSKYLINMQKDEQNSSSQDKGNFYHFLNPLEWQKLNSLVNVYCSQDKEYTLIFQVEIRIVAFLENNLTIPSYRHRY